MDLKALQKLSYGLYVVTSKKGDRLNGQATTTYSQKFTDCLGSVTTQVRLLFEVFGDEIPIHQLPKYFDVLSSDIPMVDVIRMFLYVARKQSFLSIFQRIPCIAGSFD